MYIKYLLHLLLSSFSTKNSTEIEDTFNSLAKRDIAAATCGYINGLPSSYLTCIPGYTCNSQVATPYAACCAGTSCAPVQICLEWGDWEDSTSLLNEGPAWTGCGSAEPSCATYLIESDDGTVVQWRTLYDCYFTGGITSVLKAPLVPATTSADPITSASSPTSSSASTLLPAPSTSSLVPSTLTESSPTSSSAVPTTPIITSTTSSLSTSTLSTTTTSSTPSPTHSTSPSPQSLPLPVTITVSIASPLITAIGVWISYLGYRFTKEKHALKLLQQQNGNGNGNGVELQALNPNGRRVPATAAVVQQNPNIGFGPYIAQVAQAHFHVR